MLSGRSWKWIFVAVLTLLALYAAYPPIRLAVSQVRVHEKVAETEEEAKQNNVAIGDTYRIGKEEVIFSRWLPLARGARTDETEVAQRLEDGSVVKEVTTYVDGRIKLGLDIAGGTELLYELKGEEGKAPEGTVADTISILNERIDPQRVKEFRVQGIGRDRVLIQIPKASREEVDRLKGRLGRMGRLEFKLALPPADHATEYEKARSAGRRYEVTVDRTKYEKVYVDNDESKEFFLIEVREPRITGQYLASCRPTQDQMGKPAVGFRFNAQGARLFATITERHIGWYLGIILDGVLKSAPVIRTRISGSGVIEGSFTQQEVRDLVTILQAGSLSVNLRLLQESTVGPQLGRDSITKGLRAILVGSIVVLAFIGIYYLSTGLVADGALILNLVLLAGVMGLLGAALTLPGVAGVALTVGMAVDANVLIHERIREETAAGKPIHIALRNGYDRAYSAIIDSNLTTILAAAILYVVGTGPVRGFAVTLSVGLVLSLFTSVYVTRLALETLVDREWLKGFKMFSLFKRPSLCYTRWRRLAYLMSGIVILVGMGAFFWRGSEFYDIDFTGGTLISLSLEQPIAAAKARAMLAEGGVPNAEVQAIRTPSATAEGTTDFQVRIRGVGAEKAVEALRRQVGQRLADAGLLKGDVEKTEGGRGMKFGLARPIGEMELREKLAGESGDPFDMPGITDVMPLGKQTGLKILLRLAEPGDMGQTETAWNNMLTVLAWEGVSTEQCSLEMGEIADSADAQAQMSLTTQRPVDRFLLLRELRRRGFPDVQLSVVSDQSSATSGDETDHSSLTTVHSSLFTLTAPREVLERFKSEMPTEVNLPKATLSVAGHQQAGGVAQVEAELAAPFDEEHVRTLCERQGLERVVIVALDAAYDAYTLRVGYEEVRSKMAVIFGPAAVQRIADIGAVVAGEMKGRALLAVVCASIGILLYVGVRFHNFRFGVAGVVALVHDVMVTAGLMAIADWSGAFGDVKMNLTMIAALLTILGYSINDTIVIFDRMRENMARGGGSGEVSAALINDSVNQTLSRTILTSATTFAVVVVLYFMGGPVLHGLALTLIIGLTSGTYSTVYIAAPILLDWPWIVRWTGRLLWVVSLPFRAPFSVVRTLSGRTG